MLASTLYTGLKACVRLRSLTRSHNHARSIEIKLQADRADHVRPASTMHFFKGFFSFVENSKFPSSHWQNFENSAIKIL